MLRTASWSEVVALFPSEDHAIDNAAGWAKRYGLKPPKFQRCSVTLQAWPHRTIGRLMDEMSKVEPRMTVDMCGSVNNAELPPRIDGLPAVLVHFSEVDRYGMIDGKHRANRWRCVPGNYAVLVVHA